MRLRAVHVVGLGVASLVGFATLHKLVGCWVELLKGKATGRLIVTQRASDGKVFRASVKDDIGRLGDRSSKKNLSNIDSVILTR